MNETRSKTNIDMYKIHTHATLLLLSREHITHIDITLPKNNKCLMNSGHEKCCKESTKRY